MRKDIYQRPYIAKAAVGYVNIGVAQDSSLVELINGAVARPLLLRVDDASESRSSMWVQMSMKPLESGTSHALA